MGIPHSLIAQEVVDDKAPDEEAIRTVVAQYAETWNAHDMQGWGVLFTDDVDYVDRGGGWWRFNEENVEAHRGIHERLAQRNHEMDFELTVADIAWLRPSLALVHATAQWPSFYATRGTDDRIWGVMTMVMVEDERGWRIRALQITQGPRLDQ